MSAKTIAAFSRFRSAHGASVFETPSVDVTGISRLRVGAQKRNHPTAPPPTSSSMASGLESEANELARNGHAMLARAEELRAAARAARRVERSR